MTALNLQRYQDKLRRFEVMPCRGMVARVAGLTVESKGPSVGIGQLCEICCSDGRSVPAEVVGFHNSNRVLVPLEGLGGVAPNDPVIVRSAPRCITLGEDILGRVIDGLGRPIDGKGPWRGAERRSLDNPVIPPLSRTKITEPLAFGIRAFDGLLTCGKGQRIGIFSGSGVGKSTLLAEIARTSEADVNILALVGERGREVKEFLDESLGPEGLARSVVAVATSDTSPVQRVKVAFTAATIAEYFRDQGRDVLFMMDSLTRFAQAQREIGLAAGEPPTTKGYCPSVFSLMPRLTERLGCTDRGSITGIFTILVEADDMNDPVADSVRALLDGHVVLSRRLAEMGHYPAVDILGSVSRLMVSVVTREHLLAAQKFRAVYATYKGAEDLINIGALSPGSNRRIDKAVSLIDRVNEFLVQPVGTRSAFAETVARLRDITGSWEYLTGSQGTDAAAGEPPSPVRGRETNG
ncbi:MAG TPA: FliI/YscN family ATPase [Phycisphaerae bacterium]|nr:FliI/YscN family ATPase [Phycisphaerae bacterium]